MTVDWFFGNLPPQHLPLYAVPEGLFPPDSTANEIDLYSLLPLIIRTRGLIAAGIMDESDSEESILKKLIYSLEAEFHIVEGFADVLMDNRNSLAVTSTYLPFLANLVFGDFGTSWTDRKKRVVINGLVYLWKMKATHISWYSQLALNGHTGLTIIELWKSTLYETFNYSRELDYTHQLKAARVDMVYTVGESYVLPSGDVIEVLEALLEKVRPIYVLIRKYGEMIAHVDDTVSVPVDSLAGSIASIFNEAIPSFSETILASLNCVYACETAAQA